MRRLRAALVAAVLAVAPTAAAEGGPEIIVTDGRIERPLQALVDGPAVVHLWATWCAPCREELPALAAFIAAEPDVARRVVVLSVDTAPIGRVKGFLDELGVALPSLKVASGNAGAAFGVRGYPATVFLAADGSVARIHPGALDWNAAPVRAKIAAHLGLGAR